MTTKKIKLNSTKIGEFVVKASETNVEIPQVIQIVHAVPRYQYVDGVATDTVAKIAMQAIDEKAVKVALDAGFELSEMPTFTVELQDNALVAELISQIDKLIGQKLSTGNSLIGLRWVSRSQSGSWGGLKLILTEIKTNTTNRG